MTPRPLLPAAALALGIGVFIGIAYSQWAETPSDGVDAFWSAAGAAWAFVVCGKAREIFGIKTVENVGGAVLIALLFIAWVTPVHAVLDRRDGKTQGDGEGA